MACWAHAQSEVFQGAVVIPGGSFTDTGDDTAALLGGEIGLDRSTTTPGCALHQAEAAPILERLRQELDRLSAKLLPKSALAQAVTYALNQWQALCRYTEDGRLTIDNNVSERRLRDQAIGRKNWMFLGSAEAGPRAAVICMILGGGKRHRSSHGPICVT